MKLLVVEDDPKILSFVEKGLKEEGFTVDTAVHGEDGLYLAEDGSYDAIILDWMLPFMDGIEVCAHLRKKKIATPIIMLTAKSDVEDKIEGLECGADDYLTKPFSFRELVARINSLIRRSTQRNEDIITLDTLIVNPAKRIATRNGQAINLTTKEFEILLYLLANQGSIVTHTKLQEKIWGIDEITSSNVINVFIHHLRKKVDTKGETPLIKTIRGSGYKIDHPYM